MKATQGKAAASAGAGPDPARQRAPGPRLGAPPPGGRARTFPALAALALAAGAHAGTSSPDAGAMAGPAPACLEGFGGFGHAVELSADGAALAVGAPYDSNVAGGVFHPWKTDPGDAFRDAMAGIHRQDPISTGDAAGRDDDDDMSRYSEHVGLMPKEGFPEDGYVWRSGAVHVYRLDAAGKWALEAYVKAADPAVDGLLGGALAMDAAGTTLAAGPGPAGRVEPKRRWGRGASVYRRAASGRWALEARIEPPPEGPGHDRFGWSLALSGDGSLLAVGASRAHSPARLAAGAAAAPSLGGGHAGAVRLYRRGGSGGWAPDGRLEAPGGAGGRFGGALALDGAGSLLAVGAPAEGAPPGSGAAYLYRRGAPGRWNLEARLKAPAPGPGDRFGASVALDAAGAALAVGAPAEASAAAGAFHPGDAGFAGALADDGAWSAGAVYAYRRGASGRWALEAYAKAPAAPRPLQGKGFGFSLALAADGGALAAGSPHAGGAAAACGAGGPDAARAYRRSASGRWALAASGGVHCPRLDTHVADEVWHDIALSDGGLLATGMAPGGWRGSACLRPLPADPPPASPPPVATPASPPPRGAMAYIKSPAAHGLQMSLYGFGRPLALSADGAALAVGAGSYSLAAGAFHSGDAGFAEALANDGAWPGRAVYDYRRDASGRWSLDAYLGAPGGGAFDLAIALSADGAALAVGARSASTATGVFRPGDAGFGAVVASGKNSYQDHAAAYLYRRGASGRWALEAYVKAPGAAGPLALSADGSALAVDAVDRSSATGAFHPGDAGFADALADDSDPVSVAVHLYRRGASGHWALEAYLKAPGNNDGFGTALALSADGAALAASARNVGMATGVFHRGDAGFAEALAGDSGLRGRAVHLYRRGASGRWALEAYLNAPGAGSAPAIALSADGAALAMRSYDYGSATGAFHPGDAGFDAALANEGARYSRPAVLLYRRGASGRWALEAYLTLGADIHNHDHIHNHGWGIALSADGSELAVGAADDSSATGAFRPGDAGFDAALASDGAPNSPAVHLYRRGASGRWALAAYVKAFADGAGDAFRAALALSADGATLAAGAPREDGPALGIFHAGDPGFQKAQARDDAYGRGAVYVYELPP